MGPPAPPSLADIRNAHVGQRSIPDGLEIDGFNIYLNPNLGMYGLCSRWGYLIVFKKGWRVVFWNLFLHPDKTLGSRHFLPATIAFSISFPRKFTDNN